MGPKHSVKSPTSRGTASCVAYAMSAYNFVVTLDKWGPFSKRERAVLNVVTERQRGNAIRICAHVTWHREREEGVSRDDIDGWKSVYYLAKWALTNGFLWRHNAICAVDILHSWMKEEDLQIKLLKLYAYRYDQVILDRYFLTGFIQISETRFVFAVSLFTRFFLQYFDRALYIILH